MEMTYKDFMKEPILRIYLSEDRDDRVEAAKQLAAASIDEAVRRRNIELLKMVEGLEHGVDWNAGQRDVFLSIKKLIKAE